MQHKYTITINRVRDHTLVAHALRQGLDARDPRASRVVERPRLEPATHTTGILWLFPIKDYNVRESGKALGVQGALEAKSPDPLHERATPGFHLYSQTGRLSREERERERVMSRHIDT